ncbi:MAG: transporter substrate-binding domain-containing protein [Actinomycetota bacterium]|nr:transporter substrate-binding domain-containing protein [Actinomycetota bacterium]
MTVSSSSHRGLRGVLLAGGAALALLLSACGSSSNKTTTSAAGSAGGAAVSAVTSAASSMASGASSAGGSAMSGASSGASSMSSGSGGASAGLTDADKTAAKGTLTDSSKLTVCTSLPYAPFEIDNGSGQIVGFDIDFMNAIAKDLGVQVKVVALDFSGIQSGQAMKSKKCDIAAAAMTINPERKKNITFSDPYYDASQALMVLNDSTVKSLADLKGKKLGAQTATTGFLYATKNAAANGYSVTQYRQINDEELALTTNKIDAAIHDQPALNQYVKEHPGKAKVVANFNTGEQYGFGMALGNTALTKVANHAIAQSFKDGTYKTAFEKWIGGTAPNHV